VEPVLRDLGLGDLLEEDPGTAFVRILDPPPVVPFLLGDVHLLEPLLPCGETLGWIGGFVAEGVRPEVGQCEWARTIESDLECRRHKNPPFPPRLLNDVELSTYSVCTWTEFGPARQGMRMNAGMSR
jgi:hypothetical protein